MFYRLYNSDTQLLLDQPETGMGYQIVEVQKKTYYSRHIMIVLNSELAFDAGDYSIYERRMATEGYSKMFSEASMADINILKVFRHPPSATGMVMERAFSDTSRGAIDSPKEKADGQEVFVRISAYHDDKRIDTVNKCLRSGSFATTLKDYLHTVNNRINPIARYALPNTEIIKWAFYIQPANNDMLQRGIVQPANEQPGGGEEAYFEKGTSKNTLLFTRQYGQ